mgnify:CR=1 FL=1
MRPNNIMPNGRVVRSGDPVVNPDIGTHYQGRAVDSKGRKVRVPLSRAYPISVYRKAVYDAKREAKGRFVGPFPTHGDRV